MSDEPITTTVRVATWNLWWRFGPWEERQPAIATVLAAAAADVVCIQEVWDDGDLGQAATLAERLGLHSVYGSRLDIDGVRFGNAILSRWPIADHEVVALPAPDDANELRTAVRADIDGPRGPLQVFCTHLNWRFDQSAVRQDQVRALCEFVDGSPARAYPAIMCGDFNAPSDSDEIRILTGRAAVAVPKLVFHDAWEVAGDGPGFTWSNDNPYAVLEYEPNRRIDYVFAGWPKAGGLGHFVSARLLGVDAVDGVVGSDHYGVVAELRY